MKNHLKRYFGRPEDVGTIYTGQLFEWFIQRSNSAIFTEYDILAVESLSIDVSMERAQWLLTPDPDRDKLLKTSLDGLGKPKQCLWECDDTWLEDGSSISRLYKLLHAKEKGKLGPVTTSKLLATKFPNFIPIRDSQVSALLNFEDSENWWISIRDLLIGGQPPLHEIIANLPMPFGAPAVGVLRRLDVILWMEARSRFLNILPMDAALYLKTDVEIWEFGSWIPFKVSTLATKGLVHVVTAWNPGSERPSLETNSALNENLRLRLCKDGQIPIKARGSDPDSGHFEDSWVVCGLTDKTACKIGKEFGQVAIFSLEEQTQTVIDSFKRWKISRPL
jgi:hypothetical protein